MCKQVFRDFAKEIAEDIVLEAKSKGYSVEDLAELIGISKHSITHYVYDDKIPSLPVFIGLIRKTKPVKTLKKIASWVNCAVIQLPQVDKPFSTLLRETSRTMKETADVIDTVSEAIKDNRITEEEKEKISKEIDEAVEQLLKLKKVVEGV